MRRFFVDGQYAVGESVQLKESDSKHFAKVLRGNVGDEIQIVAAGDVFTAVVQSLEGGVTAELTALTAEYSEAPIDIYLLQGLAKGERMDLVIQKAVELGVRAIIPVSCERCVVRLAGSKAADKQKRWQKIAESAAKQCGRQRVTEIMPVSSLREALAMLPEGTSVIMPWEEAEDNTLNKVLTENSPGNAAVIIGPEGGLTTAEVAAAQEYGAEVVTLGKRILRTETAAIVAVTIIMHRWGDLG